MLRVYVNGTIGGTDLALSAKGVAERMNSLELKAEGGTLLARANLLVSISGTVLGTDEDLRVLFNCGR